MKEYCGIVTRHAVAPRLHLLLLDGFHGLTSMATTCRSFGTNNTRPHGVLSVRFEIPREHPRRKVVKVTNAQIGIHEAARLNFNVGRATLARLKPSRPRVANLRFSSGNTLPSSIKQNPGHNASMDLINIKNATAWRGSTKVFDNFNLSIPSDRSTAVLGPNGAGKSTLLRIITKKIYPNPTTDCVVEIFGKSHWNVWELREQLGIVSQDMQRQYREDVNGFDVVASGFFSTVGIPDHIEVDDQQRNRAEELIRELKIESLRERRFAAMSTGEQRRFLLARALVHDPHTLIFDEPTAGLDIPGIFQYLQTARRLMQSGKTLVVVTHHVHEIPPEVSHLVLMKNGEVFKTGAKSELLNDETISDLFRVELKVVETDGYFQVLPA